MTKENRIKRAVRRGERNPATFTARNRKAERAYDNWLNSQNMLVRVEVYGHVWWAVVRTGKGLIHKGRKP